MAVNKKRKSTTKYKKFNAPILVPIIAILEVIILVGVSTYAWYYFNQSKTLSSALITVDADSGLDIDFKDADNKTYIDVWNYIDKSFEFEPATSIDGRNIYFPTSGTFDSVNSTTMTFRDGTINDINSKYINIDFELTNTNDSTMDVFLSSKSKFMISDTKNNTNMANSANGSALRLAFYNNDGKPGKVGSSLVDRMSTTKNTGSDSGTTSDDTVTLYFMAPTDRAGGFVPYAYIWYNSGSTNIVYNTSWTSAPMNKVSGCLYSITVPKTDGDNHTYNKVIFHNGYYGSVNQTADLTLSNGKVYNLSSTGSGSTLTMKTVYFLRPTDNNWGTPKCIVSSASSKNSLTAANTFAGTTGEEMKEVTTGIYSYTFPITNGSVNYNYVGFYNSSSSYTTPTLISATDNKLYYFSGTDTLGSITYSEGNIYFYNTRDWDLPYAFANAFPRADTYTYAIPMVALSKNVFYCTLPCSFLADKVSNNSNCKVYFANGNDSSASGFERTETALCQSDYIYRMLSSTDSNDYYELDPESYAAGTVDHDGYVVISPGVSAGFQRVANPVNEIDYSTGAVESIIPTFASSFDDYLYSDDTENRKSVFSIGSHETKYMSMIIWLEGTDAHCTGENYAAKFINLYLEFVTQVTGGDAAENLYTYRFYDKTEQIWTGDRLTNPVTGVSVDPVMQLYDKTAKRGYIMSKKETTTYAGANKVSVWEAQAPSTVALGDTDNGDHELEFRRVNPYNEDEVWNRWEAGSPHPVINDAREATDIISFTAFADGSPDAATYPSMDIPTKSCGGLWGNLATEQLTVYDGLDHGASNHIALNTSGTDANTLTIRYTYTYPLSNQTVDIEYRCAGGWRDMTSSANQNYEYVTREDFYSFVVPTTVYANSSNARFNLYQHFNDKYAINSNLNTSMTLNRSWITGGKVNGNFFSFNEESNKLPDNTAHTAKSSNYHSYWGSDVIYVQVKQGMDRAFNDRFVQMHFYPTTGSTAHYAYLYKNDAYKGNSSDYGAYVAVVPSERSFNNCRIETTSTLTNKTVAFSGAQKGITGGHTQQTGNTSFYHNTTAYQTTVDGKKILKNKNIMTIDPCGVVFLGLAKSCNGNNAQNTNNTFYDPKIHYWFNTQDEDGVYQGDLQMTRSYYDNAGQAVYYVSGIPLNTDNYQFHFNRNSNDYYYQTGTITSPSLSNGIELWLTNNNNNWNNLTISSSSNTHTDVNPDSSYFYIRRWNGMDFKKDGNLMLVPGYKPPLS